MANTVSRPRRGTLQLAQGAASRVRNLEVADLGTGDFGKADLPVLALAGIYHEEVAYDMLVENITFDICGKAKCNVGDFVRQPIW